MKMAGMKIWRLKVQKRVKEFMWILAHDRILSNWSRWKRKLAMNPCCSHCDGTIEDSIHAIRDCPTSKELWKFFIPQGLLSDFFSKNLRAWPSTNLKFVMEA